MGYYFELNEHPEIDQHESTDRSFLIISKSFFNQNNLPKDLNDQINGLLAQSNWAIQNPENSDERQANQLILQRRHIPTTPAYNPQIHSPVTHPQRAKVVGPEGEEIYVDEWGRIKVRFLFTRSNDHSHNGGAGTKNNDTDSAWIDVLTPWAGEGYGARFLPRMGSYLLIIEDAKRKFEEISKGEWDLKKYVVWLQISTNQKYASIGFIPNIENFIDGIPFEIPNQGMYQNGRGVQFYYEIDNVELKETIFMR